MKRNFIITLIAVCTVLVAFGVINVSAATDGIYTYSISDGKATIADCDISASGKITLPITLGGCPVTSVGYGAFSYCSSLTSITIPDTITSIGDYAFSSCSGLTSITIPDSVTSIGNSAFRYCSSLTSITIPDSVTNIGNSTFSGCTNLKDVYYTGTELEWNKISISFSNEPLTNAIIHYNHDPILGYLVYTITNGEVTITDCDTAISGEIIIPSTIEGYPVTSIGESAFYSCENINKVTIPNSVTSIKLAAFTNCKKLTNITIPDSVKEIESFAFEGCKNLTSIIIPKGVPDIGVSAFEGCENLTSITIPDSVTNIGNYAFRSCFKLTNITIPDGVTRIADSTFNGCHSLANVTIPDSVTSIGYGAFYCCSSLTNIIIPNGVTSIGDRAFVDCVRLVDVHYNGTEDEWDEISIGSDNESLTNATMHFIQAEQEEYRINSITIKDISGNSLQAIPTGTFLATVSFTNVSSNADTVIILAQYTDAGAFKGLMYIQTEDVPTGSTIKLSIPVDNSNGDVAKLKAFCWESFASLTPMGNSASFPAE